ncbi:MAP microtubule affinity-regulating kinase 1 [Phlyctochytrium bullatum]|nr:MAP microtubule affinity-regulating kinase 1 [Phlyctochytrium bullatum]
MAELLPGKRQRSSRDAGDPTAGGIHAAAITVDKPPDILETPADDCDESGSRSDAVLLTPTAVVNGSQQHGQPAAAGIPVVPANAAGAVGASAGQAPTAAQTGGGPAKQEQKHKHIGNYEIIKTVGEGSFAKVKLAIHRLTNEKVAIKVIDKESLPDEYSLKNIHREAQIMRLLDHPNIIQLYEVMETKKELYLVLEYASGGEVLDYIVAHGRLKEKEARKFIQQIVSALEYCHSLNIAHRDLKSENLLLDEDMSIKISDFGLSNIYDTAKTLGTCCGSPVYSAPELIEGRRYVGPEVDAWSLGINMYAMVVGDLPFANSNLTALYEAILKGRYEVPDFLSQECRDLIAKLLVTNPKKRYTCSQVREHPWMTMGVSLLTPFAGGGDDDPDSVKATRLRPQKQEDIDPEIIEQLEQMGFDSETAVNSILNGKFNQVMGTYLILAARKRRDIAKYGKEAVDAKRAAAQQQQLEQQQQQAANATVSSGAGAWEELEAMNRRIAEEREKQQDGTTSEALAKVMIEWERLQSGAAAGGTSNGGNSAGGDGAGGGSQATAPNALAGTVKEKGRRYRAKTISNAASVRAPTAGLNHGANHQQQHTHESESNGLLSPVASTYQHMSIGGSHSRRSVVARTSEDLHEGNHNGHLNSHVSPTTPLARSRVDIATKENGSADEVTEDSATPPHGTHYKGSSSRRPSQSLIMPTSPRIHPKNESHKQTSGATSPYVRSKSIAPGILPPLVGGEANSGLKSHHTAMLDIASAASGAGPPHQGNGHASSAHIPSPKPNGRAGGGGGRKRAQSMAPPAQASAEENLYLDPHLDVDASGADGGTGHYEGLRTIRFAFNLQTTTSMPPDQVLERLKKVLERNDVTIEGQGFLLECAWGDIKFEAEVCKLPRLKMFGIRLKRYSGDLWDYKRLCSKIIVDLDLLKGGGSGAGGED